VYIHFGSWSSRIPLLPVLDLCENFLDPVYYFSTTKLSRIYKTFKQNQQIYSGCTYIYLWGNPLKGLFYLCNVPNLKEKFCKLFQIHTSTVTVHIQVWRIQILIYNSRLGMVPFDLFYCAVCSRLVTLTPLYGLEYICTFMSMSIVFHSSLEWCYIEFWFYRIKMPVLWSLCETFSSKSMHVLIFLELFKSLYCHLNTCLVRYSVFGGNKCTCTAVSKIMKSFSK